MTDPIAFPLRLGRGLNDREHWGARAERVKVEKDATRWALATHKPPPTPCTVILTRVAPGNGVDDDQIPASCKGVRDAIADWFGIDDKHRDIVRYAYSQRRGPWGVEIRFINGIERPRDR